ncbi:MAG: hypothetical protein ABFE07_29165 [Armatimonadia bacterium]
MAKVRIRNTSGKHVGLSFTFLFSGRYCVVDESKIQPRDRELLAMMTVEDPALPLPPKETPCVPSNPPAPAKPEQPAAKQELPKQPGDAPASPGAAAPAEPAPAQPAVRHSREDLDKLSRKELKALAAALKVTGRTRAELIDGVIKAEEK